MRRLENCVFRPEAGEEDWNTAQRQHADGVGGEGERHVGLEAAHAADVLLFVDAVNDRARAHEQERLEEGVGDEVEHADGDAAEAEASHHVAELGDGGVGEDALDVVLRDGDEGGKDRGGCADPGDDGEGGGGSAGERAGLHERIDAGDEVNAGCDHGGGMNERGDGRGAFHGVGEPDVEGKLAALAGGAGEDEQADGAGGGEAEGGVLREQGGEGPAFKGAGAVVVEEQRAG